MKCSAQKLFASKAAQRQFHKLNEQHLAYTLKNIGEAVNAGGMDKIRPEPFNPKMPFDPSVLKKTSRPQFRGPYSGGVDSDQQAMADNAAEQAGRKSKLKKNLANKILGDSERPKC